MLGLFLLVSANLQRVVDEWSRSAEFSVYLRDDAAPPERDAVRRALAEHPAIAGIDAVSKEAALERFRRDFPELAQATVGAPENPFPASFEARLDVVGRRRRRPREARGADPARCPASPTPAMTGDGSIASPRSARSSGTPASSWPASSSSPPA